MLYKIISHNKKHRRDISLCDIPPFVYIYHLLLQRDLPIAHITIAKN
jgi:hypothetical protein